MKDKCRQTIHLEVFVSTYKKKVWLQSCKHLLSYMHIQQNLLTFDLINEEPITELQMGRLGQARSQPESKMQVRIRPDPETDLKFDLKIPETNLEARKSQKVC